MTASTNSMDLAVFDDLVDDARVPLSDLAERLRVSDSSVRRWASFGVRGVRLATMRIGARRYVTAKEARIFLARLNADGSNNPSEPGQAGASEVGHD